MVLVVLFFYKDLKQYKIERARESVEIRYFIEYPFWIRETTTTSATRTGKSCYNHHQDTIHFLYKQPMKTEADKIACYIRWKCGKLNGQDKQICAKRILNTHTEEMQAHIREALAVRAKMAQDKKPEKQKWKLKN